MSPPYVDTSALAKWYINERRSVEFEAFIVSCRSVIISRLVTVELRCLVGRRVRTKELTVEASHGVIAEFERDVRHGSIEVHPIEDRDAITAVDILTRLRRHPLRTLDSLHLAIAVRLGAALLATADAAMADAATALGIKTARFD